MPSVNDNFADATTVVIATNGGTYNSGNVDTTGNTTEVDEPAVSASGDRSAWWKYTPTSSGTATFDTMLSSTTGQGTDTVMAIWTGTALQNLSLVTSSDDEGGAAGGATATSLISNLSVTGGTTYWIQVGGYGLIAMNQVLRVVGPATAAAPPTDFGSGGWLLEDNSGYWLMEDSGKWLLDTAASGPVTVNGVATSNFGGAFLASGNDRQFGSTASNFGFTGTASGARRQAGSASASFTFTGTASGTKRQAGSASASFGFTGTVAGRPRKVGSVSTSFGGAFLASGNDRQFGSVSTSFGGTFTAGGKPTTFGSVSTSFGYTATSSGRPRHVGSTTTSFGFVATATGGGITPAKSGQASAMFGFSGTSAGIDRARGAASANFGGAFLASGNDRQFGSVTTMFGFVSTTTGRRRSTGSVSTVYGFVSTTTGRPRRTGVATASFGFVAEAKQGIVSPTLLFLKDGSFEIMESFRVAGGVWVGYQQFNLTTSTSGSSSGSASASFGFVATVSGKDRALGLAVANFGGAFLAAGKDRQFGSVATSLGFVATASGKDRQFGSVTTSFGFVATASGGAPSSWPSSSTTGTSGTLTNDANDYFNSAGASYSGKNFTATGTIQVVADNQTFTNCKFNGHCLVNEKQNITFTDCEFKGGIGISSSRNITVLRGKMEVFGDGDGFHITNDGTTWDNEDITLRDCYVYDVEAALGSHSDGIQVRGSLRLWVDHCYIDLGPPEFEHNAALYLENGPNGPNTDWIIEDSYFASGYGATLYIGGAGGPGIFRNNKIIPAAPPVGGDTEATDLSSRPRTAYMNQAAPVDVTASGNVDENDNPYDVHNP